MMHVVVSPDGEGLFLVAEPWPFLRNCMGMTPSL